VIVGLSQQIEAVYQRALLLKERAETKPIEPDLLEAALKELYFVLEELHTADEDIRQQHAQLAATHHTLQEERQRYRALFELAPDAYLVTDHQGIIHRANQAAETLFAKSRETLLSKPLMVLVAASDRDYLLHQLGRSQQPLEWELTLTQPHSDPVTVAVKTTWLTNPDSSSVAILWLLRDLTDRDGQRQALQAATQGLEQRLTDCLAELAQVQAQLQTEIAKREQLEQAMRKWQN
jgi:PAS domain S-box-containing protein